MKKSLLTGMLLVMGLGLFAQNKPEKKSTFSIGGEAGYYVAKGRHSKDGIRFGGSLQQEFLVNRTGITLNLGYFYPNESYYIQHQLWLMAGARYYLTKNVFAAGQLGPGLIVGNDFSGGSFVFSPGIGIKCKPVDVSLHYRGTIASGDLFSVAGIRAAIAL